MKTRKLTRKNLDELAKVMPVLSEEVQSSCMGGTIYVSADGIRFGKIGGSDEFYVIDAAQWRSINNPKSSDYNDPYLGERLSSCSDSTIQAVVGGYAKNFANYTGTVCAKSYGDDSGTQASVSSGGELCINRYGEYVYHENDLISILEHEGEHISGTSGSYWHQELKAVENQVNSSYYATTSTSFREGLANYLVDIWKNLGYDSSTYNKEKAKAYCKSEYIPTPSF